MAQITWTGGKKGVWSAKADWSGHAVPQATDVAVLGSGDIVSILAPAAAADIALDGGELIVRSSLALTGTIGGGTVDNVGGTFDFGPGATLQSLTWDGPLVIADGDTVDVTGGLTVKGPGGAGTIELQTQSRASILNVLDSETWNHETITGNGIVQALGATNADTVTLGAQETVYSAPAGGSVDFSSYNPATNAHATFVSHGMLSDGGGMGFAFGVFDNLGVLAIGAGGSANPFEETFRNAGTIAAEGGTGLFTLWYNNAPDGSDLTNYSTADGGTLAGGTWEALPGATLDLQLNGGISTSDAALVLNGPAAGIDVFDAATATYQPLADTVTSLGGSLTLAGGVWDSPQKLAVHGTVEMMGGSLSATALVLDSAAVRIVGSGTLSGGKQIMLDAGKIEADYGTLTVASNLAGAGALQVDSGAVLDLSGKAGETVTFVGVSTLALDAPRLFTGALAGVTAGDQLVLKGTNATSADLAGGILTIDLRGGASETFDVAGGATGASFAYAGGATTVTFTAGLITAAHLWPGHTG